MPDKSIRPKIGDTGAKPDHKSGSERPAQWPSVPQPIRDEIKPATTPKPEPAPDKKTGS
jgi:hypothetical protein